MFASRGEADGENKDLGPSAEWTMSSRTTPEESVVCQCGGVCVCRYPVHMYVNQEDRGLRYSHMSR